MLSAVFGPHGGPGVQRSVKFAKYLSKLGWQPTVWTAGRLPNLPCDKSLMVDFPGCVKVYDHGMLRDSACECVNDDKSRLSDALAWRFQALQNRYSQPDPLVDWARASEASLVDMLRAGLFDVIYSTYSPASNHLLALSLKRLTGCAWVADFRDLWTDDYRYEEKSPKWRQVHRRWEQEILEEADVVVGVTPTQTKILSSHVPTWANKFVTITNGFDLDDFQNIVSSERSQHDDTLELTYVGSADRWRTSDALFDGVARFACACTGNGNKLVLRVVGHVNESVKTRFTATGATCVYTGRVNHAHAIEAMCTARALLMCVPEGRNGASVVPAKLYEYLAASRPILLVGPPEGDAARIVRDGHAGVCAPFDSEAISRALSEVFTMSVGRDLPAHLETQPLRRFRRDVLAAQLAQQFERACDVAAKQFDQQIPMEAVL